MTHKISFLPHFYHFQYDYLDYHKHKQEFQESPDNSKLMDDVIVKRMFKVIATAPTQRRD